MWSALLQHVRIKINGMKTKVLFRGSEDVKNFASEINSFTSDVNIYYGHQIFDAKSILCLMSLQLFKEYEVEIISKDELIIEQFKSIVAKYGG